MKRIIFYLLLMSFFVTKAENTFKWYELKDEKTALSKKTKGETRGLSNESRESTAISFNLYPGDEALIIDKIEWEKIDTVYSTLEPFSLVASNINEGNPIYWSIKIEFPYTPYFDNEDCLLLYTNKGIIKVPTSPAGYYKELYKERISDLNDSINVFMKQAEFYMDESAKFNDKWRSRFKYLGVGVAIILIIFGVFIYSLMRKKNAMNQLSKHIENYTDKEKQLESLITQLNKDRLSIINRLCNEYYEKNDSENLKVFVYQELEKQIFTYKDPEIISELQQKVNLFHDNLLNRLHNQVKKLSKKDLIFLTYLYHGFSPRAISIFTNTNVKHFYYMRTKLKNIIEQSDAPDKEEFISKLL